MKIFLLSTLLINLATNPASVTDKMYVKSANGLILRSGPSTSSKRLIVIPNNTLIQTNSNEAKREEVNGLNGRWIKATYKGYKGWVYDGYLSSFVNSHFGVHISSKKRKNTYENVFTLPGVIPGKINKKYENSSKERININYKHNYSSFFVSKPSSFYLINRKNISEIKDYKIFLLSNGMYLYEALVFYTNKKVDPESILFSKKAYKESKNSNNLKNFRIAPNRKKVPVKKYAHCTVLKQWEIDINRDGKKELISFLRYRVREGKYDPYKHIIIITSNNKNKVLYHYTNTSLIGIFNFPFFNYPVLRITWRSDDSGDGGEDFIIFNNSSLEAVRIPIDYTHSY